MSNGAKDVEVIARAERILNRTLAYHAAIAVHALKDDLGLDVQELSLVVTPLSFDTPGTCRVVCSITRVAAEEPIVLDLVVSPEKAISPDAKNNKA
jgi:hypothetical protein